MNAQRAYGLKAAERDAEGLQRGAGGAGGATGTASVR